MKKSLIVALIALVCLSLGAVAQDNMRPIYTVLPQHNYFPNAIPFDPSAQLPQWTFDWTSSYNGRAYSSTILGASALTSNFPTVIDVGLIPIEMVYGPNNGNMTFDPNAAGEFGTLSTTQMVNRSLIFQALVDYNQGGTDIGKTQYEDAYMRGNFWGTVQTNSNYHLLLKTLLGPEQILTPPNSGPQEGHVIQTPYAPVPVGTADINWFDEQLQTIINKYSCSVIKEPCISPNVLPLFVTYDVYLTSGGDNNCCIGGYHSANGPAPNGQTYSYSTSITQASNGRAIFAQDVSALAHELGEWIMDPFVVNASPCPDNSILAVGDPLELDPTFGSYPYTVNGFTYHPQDLVYISWFGAPQSTGLSVWNGVPTNVVTFQNEILKVCQTN